jgi:hypothetical protein
VTKGPATAASTHGFAVSADPLLGKVEPRVFVRILGAGELALGTALLVPAVPSALVGLGLTAFSTGRYSDFVSTNLYDLLLIAQGTAKANNRAEVAGGLSVGLATTFEILDQDTSNPSSEDWERAFRLFDPLL